MSDGRGRPGQHRSAAASRLAGLLSEFEPTDEPGRADDVDTAVLPELEPELRRAPDEPPARDPGDVDRPVPASREHGAAAEPSASADRGDAPAGAARWRRIGFGAVVIVLVAAIPVLGTVGRNLLLESEAGRLVDQVTDPTAPGFQATVQPTPTGLVVQRDVDGEPVAATLLAQGTGDAGGSVILIPLDTEVPEPAFYIDRLRSAYDNGDDETFIDATADLLNVGFSEVMNVDNTAWAQITEPVGPIELDNPDELSTTTGYQPAGPISLEPEDVGPYLAASPEGESDLNRMFRHQVFWEAYLAAVAESPAANPVPNTTLGIGPFLETLAAGRVEVAPLDVTASDELTAEGGERFTADPDGVAAQIARAVPYPVAPGLGERYSVRLLNGVDGRGIPDLVVRELVQSGAQIDVLGNATSFDHGTTEITYHDPAQKETGERMAALLGGAEVNYVADRNETVDLVVTLGRDVVEPARSESAADGESAGDPGAVDGAGGSGGNGG